MGFNSTVQKTAADRLFERRIQAEKLAERTKAEFFEKCPRARELDRRHAPCLKAETWFQK